MALKRVILHNETSDGVGNIDCIQWTEVHVLIKVFMSSMQFPLTSLREITILKRLQHPHIVNLLDIVVGAKRER